jgi:hypothetical protein
MVLGCPPRWSVLGACRPLPTYFSARMKPFDRIAYPWAPRNVEEARCPLCHGARMTERIGYVKVGENPDGSYEWEEAVVGCIKCVDRWEGLGPGA